MRITRRTTSSHRSPTGATRAPQQRSRSITRPGTASVATIAAVRGSPRLQPWCRQAPSEVVSRGADAPGGAAGNGRHRHHRGPCPIWRVERSQPRQERHRRWPSVADGDSIRDGCPFHRSPRQHRRPLLHPARAPRRRPLRRPHRRHLRRHLRRRRPRLGPRLAHTAADEEAARSHHLHRKAGRHAVQHRSPVWRDEAGRSSKPTTSRTPTCSSTGSS